MYDYDLKSFHPDSADFTTIGTRSFLALRASIARLRYYAS